MFVIVVVVVNINIITITHNEMHILMYYYSQITVLPITNIV